MIVCRKVHLCVDACEGKESERQGETHGNRGCMYGCMYVCMYVCICMDGCLYKYVSVYKYANGWQRTDLHSQNIFMCPLPRWLL